MFFEVIFQVPWGFIVSLKNIPSVFIWVVATQTFLNVHPDPWGFMIQFDVHIFWNGLVQPATSGSTTLKSQDSRQHPWHSLDTQWGEKSKTLLMVFRNLARKPTCYLWNPYEKHGDILNVRLVDFWTINSTMSCMIWSFQTWQRCLFFVGLCWDLVFPPSLTVNQVFRHLSCLAPQCHMLCVFCFWTENQKRIKTLGFF